MTVITTRLIVAPDGTISVAAPIPAGEYAVPITAAEPRQSRPGKPFTMEDFPVHDGPWDDSISLRRNEMYGSGGG